MFKTYTMDKRNDKCHAVPFKGYCLHSLIRLLLLIYLLRPIYVLLSTRKLNCEKGCVSRYPSISAPFRRHCRREIHPTSVTIVLNIKVHQLLMGEGAVFASSLYASALWKKLG